MPLSRTLTRTAASALQDDGPYTTATYGLGQAVPSLLRLALQLERSGVPEKPLAVEGALPAGVHERTWIIRHPNRVHGPFELGPLEVRVAAVLGARRDA
eukprot:CAMPEP_0202054636 /NCGR_PEP_ID=MMETSP0963-20130614/9028_1 /ASSEMBLY_ACC=CAM_ASM_000494 /TAXON_ID=4773 /ORGANISM="Schizochytrium aggregatum, Strain ATCC28209" /LENGTH=98 /DNA_ID=CAMNT_0048620105 /DNA_START=180 /DNA_END=476 /DNA_ORIENTATION=+